MLPEAYKSQAQHIQPSPKFQRAAGGEIQAAPFPGYSVTTPPWADEQHNQAFYEQLQTFQQQLSQRLGADLFAPVPPDSFHLTLADLIWDSDYRHAAKTPEFEPQLRDRIAQSFSKAEPAVQGQINSWQAMGLILRTRAVGICLAPRNQEAYDRVLKLRRAIYQNSDLIGLGIEQQYDFTAHITLGYFMEAAANPDHDHLSHALIELNEWWLNLTTPQELQIHRAELRKFDDMTDYHRELDWPVLEF